MLECFEDIIDCVNRRLHKMNTKKGNRNENEHLYEHYYKRSAAHRGFKEHETQHNKDKDGEGD